jgi:hypothetical protein
MHNKLTSFNEKLLPYTLKTKVSPFLEFFAATQRTFYRSKYTLQTVGM